jgi:hypothetical protein
MKWDLFVAVLSLIATLALSFIAYRLSHRMARNDLLFQVRAWSDQVVSLLCRGFALCEVDPRQYPEGFATSRMELIATSSALMDQGRFFFPNVSREVLESETSAYHGLRPVILDLVLLAHGLTRRIDIYNKAANAKRREAFVQVKRHFVSVTQKSVDFRSAPAHASRYEKWLAEVHVPPLPGWIELEAKCDDRFGPTHFGDLKWAVTATPPSASTPAGRG